MKTEDLQDIERTHYRVQSGVFFTDKKEVPGATLFWNERIVDFYWNYAGFISTEHPEELIRETIQYYKSKSRNPTFEIVPWTNPNLEQILQKEGFNLVYEQSWQVYNRKTSTISPELDIREVKTTEEMQTFVSVFNRAFSGAPGDPYGALPKTYGETVFLSFEKEFWSNYLLFHEGKPVTTGGIAVCRDCAAIYSIGTDPDFRKKGFGTAIIDFLTKTALEKGCKVIFLQTMHNSYNERFYEKLGFSTEFVGRRWTLE